MTSSHHRSHSGSSPTSPRPPSPPSQTYHPSILPLAVPTPALLESVAGAAHYSSVNVEPDSPTATMRRRHSGFSHERRPSLISAGHQKVLDDLQELFCCRPSFENLDNHWRKDAIFEDPWSKCEGFDEYAAQWFFLAKLCSKSETLKCRAMSSTQSPNRLVYTQKQEYTTRLFGHKKTIESIVIVDLDDDDKIIRVIDQWNGKELPTRFGALFFRRLYGRATPWFVRVPRR